MAKRVATTPSQATTNNQTHSDENVDQSLFPSQEDLNEAEAIWGEGQDEAERSSPVGSFVCLIEQAELQRSASSDRLQIHYHLKILGGQYDGIEVDKYDGLGSPKQASITQRQLNRVGIETKGLTVKNLPAHLLNLEQKKVAVSAKQNGEYYNIAFLRMATENMAGTPRAANNSPARAPAATAGAPRGRRY